jgi:hypothetical protein
MVGSILSFAFSTNEYIYWDPELLSIFCLDPIEDLMEKYKATPEGRMVLQRCITSVFNYQHLQAN